MAGVAGNIELKNFMAAKLTVNFFVLLSGCLVIEKQLKFLWFVKFLQWKGKFWIQEVIKTRLDTCVYVFHKSMKQIQAVASFEKQMNKIRLFKVLVVKILL